MITFDDSELSLIQIPVSVVQTLIGAPQNVVKLYLYGKLHANAERSKLLADLELTTADFTSAIDYMLRSGLISMAQGGSGSIVYTYPKQQPYVSITALYKDADYNAQLQSIFGERVLSAGDYAKLYDMTEIYGLPRTVVAMLAEYCIEKKGKNVSMRFVNDEALRWAQQEIDTISRAQDYMAARADSRQEMYSVLRELGIRARLTNDYLAYYDKWTHDWGLSTEIVRRGVSVTNRKAQTPSIAYLDKVLQAYHEKGFSTVDDIDGSELFRDALLKKTTELLTTAGITRRPTAKDSELYDKLTRELRLSDDVVLFAAEVASNYSNPLKALETICKSWKDDGILTIEAAKAARRKTAPGSDDSEYTTASFRIRDALAEMDDEKYAKYDDDDVEL